MGRAQQRARGSAACLPGMSQAAEGEQPLETTGAAESRHEAAPEGESPAETAGPSTRSQTGDEADLVNRSGNEEDAGKWFVGSLSWDISKKDPKDYFTKLREVVDRTIKMDPNIGRSRGLGFILFKDVASVEKVLDQKERKVGGHRMNHKKAVTMKKDPMKKIFVGGLNPEATEEKIREYFGKFGEIEAIEFSLDPESNKRQGSVFIAFKEEEPVRSILEKFHTISGSKPPWYIVVYSSLWVLLVVAWKDTYNWIREVNNPNPALCTICRKEFGIGHGGEGDVKAHMETESHKSRMRQSGASKPIKSGFISRKYTNVQAKVAATELTWAYHTNRHALSYRSLDCSMKLSKVTFSDSEVATKISCGRTKGEILITDVLAPYSVELVLSFLTNGHVFYSLSTTGDAPNHGHKKIFPLALRYFDLKNGVSDRLLDFYEDYSEALQIVALESNTRIPVSPDI
nr:uncharacterized protein LOC100069254 [Equus caballus]